MGLVGADKEVMMKMTKWLGWCVTMAWCGATMAGVVVGEKSAPPSADGQCHYKKVKPCPPCDTHPNTAPPCECQCVPEPFVATPCPPAKVVFTDVYIKEALHYQLYLGPEVVAHESRAGVGVQGTWIAPSHKWNIVGGVDWLPRHDVVQDMVVGGGTKDVHVCKEGGAEWCKDVKVGLPWYDVRQEAHHGGGLVHVGVGWRLR